LKLLCKLFDYYADYFGYYSHYLKTPNCVSGQYSLQKAASLTRAEAEHHHSSSGTTKVPSPTVCGMAAAPSGKAVRMYDSQPARIAGRN
jgi:hypothetical protein